MDYQLNYCQLDEATENRQASRLQKHTNSFPRYGIRAKIEWFCYFETSRECDSGVANALSKDHRCERGTGGEGT